MTAANLADVKSQLRITSGDYDARLQMYLNAVTKAIEVEVGPLSVQSFSEVVQTRATALLLSHRPIVAITALTPQINTWPSFTGADVAFDPEAGTVWRRDLGTLAGAWTVDYTAGHAVVDDDVRLAQLLVVQDLWETTRGSARRPGIGAADPSDALPSSYELRRRVREVLRGSQLYNGIA